MFYSPSACFTYDVWLGAQNYRIVYDVLTLTGCQLVCQIDPKCQFFTYGTYARWSEPNRCALKMYQGSHNQELGAISGPKYCS